MTPGADPADPHARSLYELKRSRAPRDPLCFACAPQGPSDRLPRLDGASARWRPRTASTTSSSSCGSLRVWRSRRTCWWRRCTARLHRRRRPVRRFAERRGYRTSQFGGWIRRADGHDARRGLAGLVAPSAVLCGACGVTPWVLLFIWPAMEALVVETSRRRVCPTGGDLQLHVVGVCGRGLLHGRAPVRLAWRLGRSSACRVCFLARPTSWSVSPSAGPRPLAAATGPASPGDSASRTEGPRCRRFRRRPSRTLAWMANPLAYVAIYTLLAAHARPGDAPRLSATDVGLFCSIWFFGRWAAFLVLWGWTGWHYRFRWLAAAYGCSSWQLRRHRAGSGLWACWWSGRSSSAWPPGSSTTPRCSMRWTSATAKAEHGGLHEALIGGGIFAGPAVGRCLCGFADGSLALARPGRSGVLLAAGGRHGGLWRRWRGGPTLRLRRPADRQVPFGPAPSG